MVGGYNVKPLIDLLDDARSRHHRRRRPEEDLRCSTISTTSPRKAKAGNANAKAVMQSWADAEWFTRARKCRQASQITVTVFKVHWRDQHRRPVAGAPDAWSRPDIPMHALAMLKNTRPGITPEQDGVRGPIQFIEDLKGQPGCLRRRRGRHRLHPQVGHQQRDLGPARTSLRAEQAFGGVIAWAARSPDLLQHQEDAGALPIEVDVGQIEMGDVIDVYP